MNIVLVIPFKNEEKNLTRIFKQIINQKKKYSEIIFIDNNSTDHGPYMVKQFIKNQQNAYYYKSNSRYLFEVINLGVKKIKRENSYVNILSANDYISKNFVYETSKILDKNNNIGMFTAIGHKIENNKISKYNTPIISFKNIILKKDSFVNYYKKYGNFFFGPTILYNVRILKKNLFNKNLFGISDFINYLKISYFYGVLFFPKRLGVMNFHEGSYLANSYKQNKFNKILYFLHFELNFLDNQSRNLIIKRLYQIYTMRFSVKNNNKTKKILNYINFAIQNPIFSLSFLINRILKNKLIK